MGEKNFEVDDPQETARLIIHLGINLRDDLVEGLAKQILTREDIVAKIQTFQQSLERILAAPAHSLKLADESYLEMLAGTRHQENTEAQ